MQFSASANSWLLAVAVVMGANTLVAQVERPRFVLNTSGPVDAVQSVAFSPDSRRLYAGGFDKVVYAWDLIQQKRRTTANLAQTLRWQISRGQRGAIYTIAASPIDRTLAIGGVSARNANGDIVLLRTGFAGFWPDRAAYLGTDERGAGAVAKLRFPGLDPGAARWLADERRIAAVGIDTASIDFGASRGFDAHQVLARSEIPAFENVARLDALPATGAFAVALPMKIRGGSGAPLRVVAIVPDRP